jgi:hypothetical protein
MVLVDKVDDTEMDLYFCWNGTEKAEVLERGDTSLSLCYRWVQWTPKMNIIWNLRLKIGKLLQRDDFFKSSRILQKRKDISSQSDPLEYQVKDLFTALS